MLLNLKKIIISSLIIFSFLCFFQIKTVQAGLVPCGLTSNKSDKCTLCHLFEGIQNIVNWGKTILLVVALVAIVAGAIMYIISAGNSGMMESAKGLIKQALWGVAIVLGAWVIVNTSLWLIASKLYTGTGSTNGSFMSIGSWYNFDCSGGGTGGGGTGGGGGATPTTCTYTYSDWTVCTPTTTTQTRAVLSSTPSGCTGAPITTKSCSTELPVDGELPEACNQYDSAFRTAATTGGNYNREVDCLLRSIAATESGCRKDEVSPAGSVGIMQFKPSTAGESADFLRENPEWSIQKAAEYLRQNQSLINSYAYFDASDSNTIGVNTVKYPDGKGGYDTYYTGNDDLIASYNAGGGTKASDPSQLGPFAQTVACKDRAGYSSNMPAWQCPYKNDTSDELETAGMGFLETRNYVQKVQGYQKGCLGN